MNVEKLQHLYREMLRLRLIEERIADLYTEQEMRCPVHLCIGQEAVAVGVCDNLHPRDYIFSAHRSHGHYLAKGGDLKAMLAELYGKETGCSHGKGGSMHLVDLEAGFLGAAPIVGSTIPIGVGAAFGVQCRGENRVTVVFFGEGATEEGVFDESVNFALMKQLPVVFLCENNFFSVYSPLSVRRPEGTEIYELARGHGIESHQGDGNDIAAVMELSKAAIEKARSGRGPTFLEFKTYRWREHCGPFYDHELGYRTEADLAEWQLRCPLRRTLTALQGVGVTEATLAEMEAEINTEIDQAVAFAKESPFPAARTAFEGVYA